MASLFSRLSGLVPGFRSTGLPASAPISETPAERSARTIAETQAALAASSRRPRPSTEEKVPRDWTAGIAGKVWFLPFRDSTTKDTPEIRAAMRLMRRDPYVKAGWEPQILAVASEDYQVQASEPGNPESEEQADAFRDMLEAVAGGMPQLVRAVCAALGSDGHSLAEKVWGVGSRGRLANKIVLAAAKPKDTNAEAGGTVRLLGDEYGNITHVESLRKHGVKFPISDFLYSRYLTVFDEPLGEAAFRPSYGCYDDQTEILTKSGWKLFADLTDADEVATLEPDSGRMVYEVPSDRQSFPFKGKLFHQKSKFIDVRVTPNHRMWIGSHRANKFRFVEASKLMDGSIGRVVKYKRNAKWIGEERKTFTLPAVQHAVGTGKAGITRTKTIAAKKLPMDDWLRFFGLWLADGSTYREKTGNRQCWINITQNPGPVLDEILAVAKRLGFTVRIQKPSPGKSACDLRISSLQLWEYLSKLGKSHTKFIPSEFKELSSRQLAILLDWMLRGDGRHDFGNGRTQYASVSKRLADDVGELALKTGKAANIYREKMAKGDHIWIVGLNTAGIEGTVVNRHGCEDGRSWEAYDGLVSCVTTKNGIVYVRRNGKACWCGNSYWMRDTVRKLRAIHHEKKMAGMLKGTYENDDDKGPLEEALRKAKTATWIAVPAGCQVEAINLSTASEPDYKSFDESLRDEIVIGIAFATLQILMGSSGGAGGEVRGSADVQKQISDLGPWFLMAIVQATINTQLAPDFIDFNYPYPAGGGYPKLTFGAVSNEEILREVAKVKAAMELGIQPSKKHYSKAWGIQQANVSDPDDALRLPTPAQVQAVQGGGFGAGGMPGVGAPAPVLAFAELWPRRRPVAADIKAALARFAGEFSAYSDCEIAAAIRGTPKGEQS